MLGREKTNSFKGKYLGDDRERENTFVGRRQNKDKSVKHDFFFDIMREEMERQKRRQNEEKEREKLF